ncbi:MAG: hypothetical protein ACR2OJ_06205 [Hyphomicrobiales bacterium]
MLWKVLITCAVVAAVGFGMKRFANQPKAKPVKRDVPPGSDGSIAKLRKDPKTGEYVPEDE